MKRFVSTIIIAIFLALIVMPAAEAIVKVPKSLNFISFYGGSGNPVGKYDAIPGDVFFVDGQQYEFNASDTYDPALFLGFDYGQSYGEHMNLSLGFRYVNHQLRNPIGPGEGVLQYSVAPKLKQYDLGIEVHYMLNDLRQSTWSPYAGVSMSSGITTVEYGNALNNENRLNVAIGVDFGAEVRIYSDEGSRRFVTLASTNSYTLLGTGDRPKYLHFGGAIKYYYMN